MFQLESHLLSCILKIVKQEKHKIYIFLIKHCKRVHNSTFLGCLSTSFCCEQMRIKTSTVITSKTYTHTLFSLSKTHTHTNTHTHTRTLKHTHSHTHTHTHTHTKTHIHTVERREREEKSFNFMNGK